MRDLLLAGRRLVVPVRPTRSESPRQRIESLLAHWERLYDRPFPRPVVVESDLTEPDIGLDAGSLRWIRRNCVGVIHNAASLAFQADTDGEPFRTNVDGTRRVLELCRTAGIRQFHYVSTAYVCGMRTGTILESEWDVGQKLGNVYEESKLTAERMVRSDDFIAQPTIYRPSIIVGDSQTGFTTTFHGFYTALRLGHTLSGMVLRGSTGGDALARVLGLEGHENKNFVPVDWVSAVITHVHGRDDLHGKTYHVTSHEPTNIFEMASAFQQAIEAHSPAPGAGDEINYDGDWFEEMFSKEMAVYEAYWRDDPVFDRTNTRAAAAHLPCPRLDRDRILRLAKYAIDTNFGRKRRPGCRPEFDIHEHLSDLLVSGTGPDEPTNGFGHIGLQVDGPGGGQWELFVDGSRILGADPGVSPRSTAVCHLHSRTFRQMALRELTASQAVSAGLVHIEGNGMAPDRVSAILQAAADLAPALQE